MAPRLVSYTGLDPSAIDAAQYDFLTLSIHELAHTVGLGESSDPNSVMYEYLLTGTVRRTFTESNLTLINTDADRFMKVSRDYLDADPDAPGINNLSRDAAGSPRADGEGVLPIRSVAAAGSDFTFDRANPIPFPWSTGADCFLGEVDIAHGRSVEGDRAFGPASREVLEAVLAEWSPSGSTFSEGIAHVMNDPKVAAVNEDALGNVIPDDFFIANASDYSSAMARD